MFWNKVKYEDEKRPMPVIVEMLIGLLVVGAMFFAAYEIADWSERHDASIEYGCEVEDIR